MNHGKSALSLGICYSLYFLALSYPYTYLLIAKGLSLFLFVLFISDPLQKPSWGLGVNIFPTSPVFTMVKS